jgi:hypothetical protein
VSLSDLKPKFKGANDGHLRPAGFRRVSPNQFEVYFVATSTPIPAIAGYQGAPGGVEHHHRVADFPTGVHVIKLFSIFVIDAAEK